MSLSQIRELLQSLCLLLHVILIFRITMKMGTYDKLFGLIAKGNEIISEQWENFYKAFENINGRLEKLEKSKKENEK